MIISGSLNALRLLLNVEQYEIMRGPQIDAGVKVIHFVSYALVNKDVSYYIARRVVILTILIGQKHLLQHLLLVFNI